MLKRFDNTKQMSVRIDSACGIVSIDKDLIVHHKSYDSPINNCSNSELKLIKDAIGLNLYTIDTIDVETIQQKYLSEYYKDKNCHTIKWYDTYKTFYDFDIEEIIVPLLANNAICDDILAYGWFDFYDSITHSPIEIYPTHCIVYINGNDRDAYKEIGEELNKACPSIFSGSSHFNGGSSVKPNRLLIYFAEEYANKLAKLKKEEHILFPLKVHYLNTD